MIANKYLVYSLFPVFILLDACKKVITIDPPVSSITTAEAFADSADANSAILGIYSKMINSAGAPFFGDGAISILSGLSADELVPTGGRPNLVQTQVYINQVLADNGTIYSAIWSKAYELIYQANACIEGLNASSTIDAGSKAQFLGEATFLRALCYFYLVNLFGDVPYVTSATSWNETADMPRTNKDTIFAKLIADLRICEFQLRADYSMSNGERTRVNQAGVTALLAKIYLHQGDWKDAVAAANLLIGNSTYSLVGTSAINTVFAANSPEAILQWQVNPSYSPFYATAEGFSILPANKLSPPRFSLSNALLNSFEAGDARTGGWVSSVVYRGKTYFYPYKYKIGPGNNQNTPNYPEYYMVFRLAEQYLIRAEAEFNLGDLVDAISDINTIRTRAGLAALSGTLTGAQVMSAIIQERRIELFCEWGNRWLDLKRWNIVDSVMDVATPAKIGGSSWQSYQKLYPIPLFELQADPNLTQNPGYN